MSFTYANRKKTNEAQNKEAAPLSPSLDALRAGTAAPTGEQLGHRVDLPDAMREKMENAFGADLSAVKLYESQAVDDAGANAITQGSNIAFAPGMLDFTSYGGQALLGHEISHVVSQARGEVTGSGFLNDHTLEARADREGAMAAAGQTVAAPYASMSPVSAASASGPMQAGKKERRQREANTYRANEIKAYDDYVLADDPKEKARLKAEYEKNRDLKVGRMKKLEMSQAEIDADNQGTTSPMAQLMRAHDRHYSRVYSGEGKKETDARAEREKQSTAYLGNLQKIMDNMSDDELKANPLFQKSLVDAYGSVHRRLYSPGVSGTINGDFNDYSRLASGPYLPGNGRDLLGSMYGRLMGANNIRAAIDKPDDTEAINDLSTLAEQSGAAGLMDRQYQKAFGETRDFMGGPTNLRTDRTAMREMLSKVVSPLMADSAVASKRVSDLDASLTPPPAPARGILDDDYDTPVSGLTWEQKKAQLREKQGKGSGSRLSAAKNAVVNAGQSIAEGIEDAASSVKNRVEDHKEKKRKKKEEQARQESFDKDLEKWKKPATKKELKLFREAYGSGTTPSGEQLARLRTEIELAKSLGRPVNVRGACGELEPSTETTTTTPHRKHKHRQKPVIDPDLL